MTVEGELWHDQQRASRLREIAVHLAFGISEHAQPEDLLRHPFERRIGIGRRETGEHEKAGPDSSGNPACDSHLRPRHPLEDDPHSTVTLFAKFRG